MYHLMIKTSFAAAHNLINYQGDCENLHGHNWRVEVTVAAKELDKAGLGIDFKILKKQTNGLLDELDHKYLNDLTPFKEDSPSSENISRYLFERLSKQLNNDNITVEQVNVWESENACASYTLK
jgi:6-pyruvoyltetrahydropterin/6-carboxytetrahydropterin synthase